MATIKYKENKLGRYRKGVVPMSKKSPPKPSNNVGPVVFMVAKYKGRCVSCNGEIEVGQNMRWHREKKLAKHAGCK